MYDNRKRETGMELLEKILSKENLNKAYKQEIGRASCRERV